MDVGDIPPDFFYASTLDAKVRKRPVLRVKVDVASVETVFRASTPALRFMVFF
jgi:hypothetical protein